MALVGYPLLSWRQLREEQSRLGLGLGLGQGLELGLLLRVGCEQLGHGDVARSDGRAVLRSLGHVAEVVATQQ